MAAEVYVKLLGKHWKCNQGQIARRLNVSPTQITKWKQGEHMSSEFEKRLRKILGIGDKDPKVVLAAGSIEAAEKWEKLIQAIAQYAKDESPNGHNAYPLDDELGLLVWDIFDTLLDMGADIPKPFPKELEMVLSQGEETLGEEEEEFDSIGRVLLGNPCSSSILQIFQALVDVWGFHATFIDPVMWHQNMDQSGPIENIEPCLLSLAACKVAIDQTFAPKFNQFKARWLGDYAKWINELKERAFASGIPLKAELMEIVYKPDSDLLERVEVEQLGFNSSQPHPDIYMNELLVGMRIIHQVLPTILRKLEIEDEFELDQSELSVK